VAHALRKHGPDLGLIEALRASRVLPRGLGLGDPGKLPLSPDLLRFHKAKIEERARYEKRPPTFQMVIDDVYAISKGQLVGRPR
jgi:glutamate mutase epsilon subunit